MRDPRQEALRIPHGFMYAPDGGVRVVLYHETDGTVQCEAGTSYSDALSKAVARINDKYPGRTL